MDPFVEIERNAVTAVKRTPVVLVHGWAGSADSWQPILDRLDPAMWDATAMRLPGSPGGDPRNPTVAHGAEQLTATLEGLPSPAVLVGHSMGAQVTLLAHAGAPHRVLSEVVIDPAYAGDADSRAEMAAWADRIAREGHPAVSDFFQSATDGLTGSTADQLLTDLRQTAPDVIASYLRSEYVDDGAIGLNPGTAFAAAGRRHRVLSVHSTDASAQREASLPSPAGSESQTWQRHGHFLHLQDPDRFVAVLDRWRDRLLSDGASVGDLERQPG